MTVETSLGQETERIRYIIQQYAGGNYWNFMEYSFDTYEEAQKFIKENPVRFKNASIYGMSDLFRIAQTRFELYADPSDEFLIDKRTGRVKK